MDDLSTTFSESPPPLPASFFERETVQVAKALLGCKLMRQHPETRQWQAYSIVETEAYTENDPACHAYQRKTGRAEMLYQKPGTAYIYLIYGMYNCLNVVTEPAGIAGAVLFRALEPPSGSTHKTNGPGRLTRALQISRQQFNGQPLTQTHSGLYLAAGPTLPDHAILQTTRIGITKAADYPWRFYIKESPWVSVRCPSEGPRPKKRTFHPLP